MHLELDKVYLSESLIREIIELIESKKPTDEEVNVRVVFDTLSEIEFNQLEDAESRARILGTNTSGIYTLEGTEDIKVSLSEFSGTLEARVMSGKRMVVSCSGVFDSLGVSLVDFGNLAVEADNLSGLFSTGSWVVDLTDVLFPDNSKGIENIVYNADGSWTPVLLPRHLYVTDKIGSTIIVENIKSMREKIEKKGGDIRKFLDKEELADIETNPAYKMMLDSWDVEIMMNKYTLCNLPLIPESNGRFDIGTFIRLYAQAMVFIE